MSKRSGLHAYLYILTQSSNHTRLVPVKLREIVRNQRLNLVTVPRCGGEAWLKKGKKKEKDQAPLGP